MAGSVVWFFEKVDGANPDGSGPSTATLPAPVYFEMHIDFSSGESKQMIRFPMVVKREGLEFIAYCPLRGVYGSGTTRGEARSSLLAALTDTLEVYYGMGRIPDWRACWLETMGDCEMVEWGTIEEPESDNDDWHEEEE